jgi:uncharacterized membrane protein YagU involved in acid resistance
MSQDLLIASLGGVIGTTFMTGLMLIGKKLGLPAVDAHGILGFVQKSDQANSLGYFMHWIMGIVFALGYALVFRFVPGSPILLGVILGIIHWLVVGWMFAFAPLVHAGMKAGTVEETGAYMLKSLGMKGFIAGMVGHIIFGLAVVSTYAWLGGTFAS